MNLTDRKKPRERFIDRKKSSRTQSKSIVGPMDLSTLNIPNIQINCCLSFFSSYYLLSHRHHSTPCECPMCSLKMKEKMLLVLEIFALVRQCRIRDGDGEQEALGGNGDKAQFSTILNLSPSNPL